MGRYKDGINGPFSGKVGQVIGSSCRGITYLRSMPNKSKKRATQAQKNQRLKLAIVSGWLRPVLHLINIGYRAQISEKTAMNSAVSHHMKQVLTGIGPNYGLDFSKAIFSRGELLVSFVKEVVVLVDQVLHVKWENGPESAFCAETDLVTFILYNSEKEEFVTYENAVLRFAKEVDLKMPKNFAGDAVHAWMHLTDALGDKVSTSVYLGLVPLL
ncbi:hypothetical protein DBR11_13590 [Pedobacter sp. HMWF019]|uniref:DUF6266 family protein n=1 Tax=Pedobacter sp. HMWF019 TaxID=2056856 RepID=UPI000D372752|nr:DUF6266 family protein [Pedobacter sp. HMWF019]PTS99002.1 hypothetical protein DBR11_13590 [Pedobacter sp. HMWF019]